MIDEMEDDEDTLREQQELLKRARAMMAADLE